MNISLWIAQIIIAASLIAGAVLKFMPVAKTSAKMPWMGQIPMVFVRLLGILDLLAAAGLVLPMALNIMPQLTLWAAIGTIALMLSAVIFHISRGEKSDIGFNLFVIAIALFVAWGRFHTLN